MLALIRIILFGIWIVLITSIGIVLCLARPKHPENLRDLCYMIQLGKYILGVKLIKRNLHHLDDNHPAIVISNHQSNWDILPGAYMIPPRTYTVGKKSILFIPFFGLFYYLTGNILIDRSNKKRAFGIMDAAANAVKNENKSIWIMPEGTRSRGRGLMPFKKGPFIAAIKAQRPIVPIAWSHYVGKLNFNKWHAGTIIADVLPPISTEGLTLDDAVMLKDKAHALIDEALKRLDIELSQNE